MSQLKKFTKPEAEDGKIYFDALEVERILKSNHAELERLRQRERDCPTMLEAEARALMRGMQECAALLGLEHSPSPADVVAELKRIVVVAPPSFHEVLHGDVEAWLEAKSGDEVRAAIKALILGERRVCVALCTELATSKKDEAAKNNGRLSDLAFGQVAAAEELALSIQSRPI